MRIFRFGSPAPARLLAAGAIIALSANLPAAPVGAQAIGGNAVFPVLGQAGYQSTPYSSSVPVNGRTVVADGGVVATGYNSNALVLTQDGSEIAMGPSTTVVVQNAYAGSPTTVQLRSGQIRFNVRHARGRPANYLITTPRSSIAVHGTIGLVNSDQAGDTIACLSCDRDDVIVSAANQTYHLQKDQVLREEAIAGAVVVVGLATAAALGAFSAAALSTTATATAFTGAAASAAAATGATAASSAAAASAGAGGGAGTGTASAAAGGGGGGGGAAGAILPILGGLAVAGGAVALATNKSVQNAVSNATNGCSSGGGTHVSSSVGGSGNNFLSVQTTGTSVSFTVTGLVGSITPTATNKVGNAGDSGSGGSWVLSGSGTGASIQVILQDTCGNTVSMQAFFNEPTSGVLLAQQLLRSTPSTPATKGSAIPAAADVKPGPGSTAAPAAAPRAATPTVPMATMGASHPR